MKKLKNEMHEISTVEIWAAGTLFFSTGALAGGVLFGVFSTGGNAADVVAAVGAIAAAVGTWVIGYGAWKYAREAHSLRQDEVRAQQAGLLGEKFSVLNRLRHIVHCTRDTMHQFGEHLEDEGVPIDAVEFLASCEACTIYIGAQDWEAVALMARDPGGLDMLSVLRLRARDLLKECAAVIAAHEDSLPNPLPRSLQVSHVIISVVGMLRLCNAIEVYEVQRREKLLAEARVLELAMTGELGEVVPAEV
ncbi:hypothetical protein [Stenotrophomonas maltophilia]|uniref:hypothetical protein n=1 Tax=Stenotrophomonas maltophilia TaxID=40324 RepID=UPI001FA805A6|nr:hypothetical protein [Stenotrophomonas maltophilia]MBN5078125.1 hypothetical protein [Stenotrophomonas maltophilia]